MNEDQDNAGEVVAGAVRVALTAAGQLAERAARRREADLRDAERESAARVATLQSQLAVERDLALQSVRDVVQRGGAASVGEVVRAWEQARSWDDPTMHIERVHLEDLVQERFGVDASRVERGSGEQMTASALMAHDVELQKSDSYRRGPAETRVAGVQAALVDAGIDEEAAAARALAAESHPTPVGHAARSSRAAAVPRPRARRRQQSAEVQGRGR